MRFLKRLNFYHWIIILFVVLFVGTFINEGRYPHRNLPSTRAWNLYHHMSGAFFDLPADSYSYFRVDYYHDDNPWLDLLDRWELFHGWKVCLEIGVSDQAAIDKFLASWRGEQWDRLVLIPDDCSLAKQEEFARRAKEMDWGAEVQLTAFPDFTVHNFPGSGFSSREFSLPLICLRVRLAEGIPADEALRWQRMPQRLKDLAEEMGIPEEIIDWSVSEAPGELSFAESLPEESSSPDQPSRPDAVPDPEADDREQNPDTADFPGQYSRLDNLIYEVQEAFLAELPESCYNHFHLYDEGTEIVLEIAVTDEAAVDEYLSGWTGEKWDRLVKTPARVSRAKLTEFVAKAEQLDFGPEVEIVNIAAAAACNENEAGVAVWLEMSDPHASREAVEPWTELPQQLKDLAKETDIPEELIVYTPPYYHEPGVNYDT